jgi:hypothetical protein
MEQNYIVRMEKQSGKMHELAKVDGSSYHAATFGPVRIIATTAEPNPAVPSPDCALHASRDGDRWERIVVAKKDFFHPHYFNWGTLILPTACHDQPRGIYSGQAVKQFDDQTLSIEFT